MAYIRDYRIVISDNPVTNERRAAAFIAKYLRLVTGIQIPTVSHTEDPQPLEIVVGKTNRETLDGLTFRRDRDSVWAYEIRTVGSRLYLTGLGCPRDDDPALTEEYRVVKDGCHGTIVAAYRFVDKILGYQFLYETFDVCPYDPNIQMPENFTMIHTSEELNKSRPVPMDGTVMYILSGVANLEFGTSGLIYRTKSGKLVILDGSHTEDTEYLVECLETLCPGKKPVVSAWLFSHAHSDHYGTFVELCQNPELSSRIEVEHVYCNFLPPYYYTKLSKEKGDWYAEPISCIEHADSIFGCEVHTVQVGDHIVVDELDFEVLHVPSLPLCDGSTINDTSVIFKLTHESGQTMMLLTDGEAVVSKALLEYCPEKLKSDIVQVGHHGCWNVNYECYRRIGAKAAFLQICDRYWYGEGSEGMNTFNTGQIRTRNMLRELGMKRDYIYRVSDGILALPLPMDIQ